LRQLHTSRTATPLDEPPRQGAASPHPSPSPPPWISPTPLPRPTPAPNPYKKEPKLERPLLFSGSVKEFRNFMAQCGLHFTLCPSTFDTNETKVLFIVSLLRGQAFNWARAIAMDPSHPMRHDYPAFQDA